MMRKISTSLGALAALVFLGTASVPAQAADLYLINKTVDPLTLYVGGARACDAAPGAECQAAAPGGVQTVRVVAPDGKTLETDLTLGPDPLRWTVFYGDPGGRKLAGTAAKSKRKKKRMASSGGGAGPWYVQLGSFTSRANAERLANSAGGLGAVTVQAAQVGGKTWHRVRVGPSANRKDALAVWVKARKSGYTVAQIVR